MEENAKLFESLLEKTRVYGKTNFELVKMKALEKSADVVSTAIPRSVVFLVLGSFMLFASLGLAFWLGEILGKLFLGFLLVAAFYFLVAFVLHFFMNKWLKKKCSNYFIDQILK